MNTDSTVSTEAALSLSSDADFEDAEEEVNPFLPMARSAVRAVLGFGAFYTLFVCSTALFHAHEGGISMIGVALSSAWLIFWTFWPFIFYRPPMHDEAEMGSISAPLEGE